MSQAALHATPRVDINTTPLVDVMLVLLIIFMITAPLLSQRVPFRLPGPGPDVSARAPLQLSLQMQAGQVQTLLDGQLLSPAQLRERLIEAGRMVGAEQPAIEVLATDQVPYADVVQTLGQVRQAGIRALTVGTTGLPVAAPD